MHVDMCFRPDFSATFLKIVEPNHMFFSSNDAMNHI